LMRSSTKRFQSSLLRLKGVEARGACCNVMFFGFCGLVPVGVFGFPLFFGFCGGLFIFFSPSCFGVLFVYFLYA
jgi:hypothetical protein